MMIQSVFKLKTKSGFDSIDEVKSAIQKYARRGNTEKMFEAITEMDAFASIEHQAPRAVKAIRTNMINRLKVMLFEDVSFSQRAVFTLVIQAVCDWEHGKRTDRSLLADIAHLIASAKKLRHPSFIRAKFGTGKSTSLTEDDFLEGIDSRDVSCMEWIYHNEVQALNLLAEHLDDETAVRFCTAEYKRLKRSPTNERLIFLVVPWLWVMHRIDENADENEIDMNHGLDVDAIYDKTDVEFDDFVFDIHTKKGRRAGMTVQDFYKIGSFVENEDEEWLDQELKDHYVNQEKKKIEDKLAGKKEPKQGKPTKAARKRTTKMSVWDQFINDLPIFEVDLDEVVFQLDGLCGKKLPVCYVNKAVCFKPVNKTFNYGLDYVFVDKVKKHFDLNALGMRLMRIEGKQLVRVEPKVFEWQDSDEGQVVAVMNRVDAICDLGKHKKVLMKDEDMFREMIKIRLFNGLFRTSDNILRNILVTKTGDLFAIDENDMMGKRKNIFNISEPIKKCAFFTQDLIEEVLDEMNVDDAIEIVLEEFDQVFPSTLFDKLRSAITARMVNYRSIVLGELGWIDFD